LGLSAGDVLVASEAIATLSESKMRYVTILNSNVNYLRVMTLEVRLIHATSTIHPAQEAVTASRYSDKKYTLSKAIGSL